VRRSLLSAAAGIAALCLAIPLALLGRAVLAAPPRADVVRPGGVRADRSVFDRAADGLLGIGGDEPFFALVREYRHAIAAPATLGASSAPLRLARLAGKVNPRGERSQAHVMVGALFSLPAGDGSMTFGRMRQFGGGRLIDQAVAEFREAAMLDDGNEAAKYDLELVLASQNSAFAALSGRRQTPTKRPPGRSKHQGRDVKHPRSHRRLRQGGTYGTGKGY
jgi:hypothetical protein